MATGTVLQFDQMRGYGFIAADDGGEDVFLHASVFDGDSDGLAPGMQLEFKVIAGDRGRKAFAAHLVNGESGPTEDLTPQLGPILLPRQGASLAATQVLTAPGDSGAERGQPEDDQMCDVLTTAEFNVRITELLLNTVPGLTGQQILGVRQSLLGFAKKHGWSDG